MGIYSTKASRQCKAENGPSADALANDLMRSVV